VRDVIASGTSKVPTLSRHEKAEAYQDEIVAQYASCKGNLIRVHEELQQKGAQLSYQALTAYCRRHGIGYQPPEPAGRYEFAPGKEMQHDTSPHHAMIGGRLRPVQIAGLVLAYSRLSYMQLYPRFTRFECKVFLDEGIEYSGGVCGICMIDNTGVIVLHGTGADMVPVPEMEAFGKRRGFEFRAHEKGDANRSARVEGFFDHVQNNFLAGRAFRDWEDANRQAIVWCDKINAAFSRKLHASRRELFATERAHLKPLPAYRPEVYRLHDRIVDLEGYVNLHGFKYSMPPTMVGRRVEVRETKSQLKVFDGPRLITTHQRRVDGPVRVCLPEHGRDQKQQRRQERLVEEERHLRAALPEFGDYIAQLRKRARRGRIVVVLRRLHRMVREYPRESVVEALRTAQKYGLFDLDRIEAIVLRGIQGNFFPGLDADDDCDEAC
jgi:hypothetical protein